MCPYGWSCFSGNEIWFFDLQTSRLSDFATYHVLLASTSYSVTRILFQAHAYAIYYGTKYLSIIFITFIY